MVYKGRPKTYSMTMYGMYSQNYPQMLLHEA